MVISYSLLLIPYSLMWGYSRCARYWLPAKSTDKQLYNKTTIQQNCLEDSTLLLRAYCSIVQNNQQPSTNNRQPTTNNRQSTTLKKAVRCNISPFKCSFLTVVKTFSCTFYEKYFFSFVIPPFHLCVSITLIIN